MSSTEDQQYSGIVVRKRGLGQTFIEAPYIPIGGAAVIGALGYGVVTMMSKGNDPIVQNRMMRARVGIQLGVVGMMVAAAGITTIMDWRKGKTDSD